MAKIRPVAEQARMSTMARTGAWLNMLFVDHSIFRFFYNTRYQVTPDLYRSSHPMPYQLRSARRAGVRSVISLRGDETHIGSNRLEWETCAEIDLPMVHYPIGSRDAPERGQILAINELYSSLPRPILIHCKSGADRAGLASTLFLLMQEQRPLEEAIKQMSFWRFGHIKQAKTGILDHFFEVYREHRDRHGTAFEDWVTNHYDREAVRASFHSSWWANQIVDFVLRRE